MIISFSVSNFRSFHQEESLNLVASNRFAGSHPAHLAGIPGKDEFLLRTAVLYGANGAGKSNLFKALEFTRESALKSRKKQSGTGRQRFRFASDGNALSSFDLQFQIQGKLYRYGFKADDVRIAEEWLLEVVRGGENVIFERSTDADGKVTVDLNAANCREKLKALATVGGLQNQTFLSTIRSTLNTEDYGDDFETVFDWLENHLQIVSPESSFARLGHLLASDAEFASFAGNFLQSASTGVDQLVVHKEEVTEEQLKRLLPEKILSKIRQDAESGSFGVIPLGEGRELLVESDREARFHFLSIQASHQAADGNTALLDFNEESDGTRRLLHLIPALHKLKQGGAVFCIDEIDRSLHPALVWKFLEFFLNSCQASNSQILLTTHESNLLDLELLRRDEIWFVEKDIGGGTRLYSLADFKIRKDVEVRKHYLQGRFGAVPFLGNLDLLGEEVRNA